MADGKEVVGVECPVCHDEAFQLVEREVTVVAKCCPRCVARIDGEREEKTTQEAIKAMEKVERKQYLQQKSFDWAESLHGQRVTLFWDVNLNQVFCSSQSPYSVEGIGYRMQNASGGWGQVKVVLVPEEQERIIPVCHGVMYCPVVEHDMFWWRKDVEARCKVNQCKEWRPSLDGRRFGLVLYENGDGGYYTTISWAARKSVVGCRIVLNKLVSSL